MRPDNLADRIHVLLEKELHRLEALQTEGGLTDDDLKRLTAVAQTYVRINSLRPEPADPTDGISAEDLSSFVGTIEEQRGIKNE